ncbi:MAG TPA: redox-sensing transcriptional repressor Rex [Firmicutes bacterium]|nr:redox-sensing transcriptional repressor Rex [Bacillota bacterium]
MPRKGKKLISDNVVPNPQSTDEQGMPLRVAQRLPVYLRHLRELSEMGVERISSAELGALIGVTSSQLKQDLSYIGGFGQQGYGFRVDDLYEKLSQVLGLDQRCKLILVGAGNLGKALVNYDGFRRLGYHFVAIFDNDPATIGSRVGVMEVQHVDELPNYLRSYRVDIGVLTVPETVAQEVAETMVENGIKAIWSFAPVQLRLPGHVLVEHLHLSDSLMSLAFRLHYRRQQERQAKKEKTQEPAT